MRAGKRVAVVVVSALVVAGLSLAAPGAGASAPAQGADQKCPLNALKKADKPVEITFWTATNSANTDALDRLTAQYNDSQGDVRVTIVNQTTYDDALEKYVAGLSTGNLPQIVMIEDSGLQQMIDTQSILPAQACVKAEKYDVSDHLERVIDYYTVDGTLWPMPFNVSNPVLYFNEIAFEKAGLDPAAPPTTLDELRSAAEQIKAAGIVNQAGLALKLEPGNVEQWLALAGKPFVDNGNGRKARATATVIGNKTGNEVFAWLSDVMTSGAAVTNEAEGSSSFDNLLSIGADNTAMTIDTSAALGTISQVLGSGQYPNTRLGVAPMPGPAGNGGVVVDGAALYISNQSDPAQQAAAWDYLKFLNTPETQADWAASTGYVPIRESATELPLITELWAREPGFKVAFDQLLSGANNAATAGPVIGDYKGVHDSILEALQAMNQGTKPKPALKAAIKAADARIQEYNERVGA